MSDLVQAEAEAAAVVAEVDRLMVRQLLEAEPLSLADLETLARGGGVPRARLRAALRRLRADGVVLAVQAPRTGHRGPKPLAYALAPETAAVRLQTAAEGRRADAPADTDEILARVPSLERFRPDVRPLLLEGALSGAAWAAAVLREDELAALREELARPTFPPSNETEKGAR